MAQQFAAVDTAIRSVGIGKMLTDITECSRTQQGIAQRVQQDIAIGMRDDTVRMRDTHTAERHTITGAETMHIIAVADTHAHTRCLSLMPAVSVRKTRRALNLPAA